MPKRTDVLGEQLEELTQDLRDVWRALRVDPRKQARKERAWGILTGILGAVATMAARRAAAKAWGVLTGEQPPLARPAPASEAEPSPRPPETRPAADEPVASGNASGRDGSGG